MTLAVYPGSFDPITNGHLSILRRALEIFPRIVVAIGRNSEKKSLFTVDERLEIIGEVTRNMNGVRAESFDGLLMNYVTSLGSNVVLRGMRAMSDFEYEFQMALMNRKINKDVQTVFLMTDYKWFYVSSTIIKEAASLGGNISGLVPQLVERRLAEKFAQLRAAR